MLQALVKKYLPKNWWRTLLYALLITVPVILFVLKFSVFNRHGIFAGEDWDYFAQSYEAARLSILHYHQFPWWNPWVNGGQPLFANPQFGLFSLQTPLVLVFGTLVGLHYSLLLYYILGFWGMYRLLQRLGSDSRILTVCLSYIWIFSGFAAWHLSGGHYTFVIYLLAPWAFLTVLNIHKKRGWLWFGLIASLMIQSAMHYLTIETLIICGIIALIQLGREIYTRHLRTIKALWPLLKPYLYAGILVLVLCGVRIFYVLQFTHQYPRLQPPDPPVSYKLFVAALTFRHAADPSAITVVGVSNYGWTEYADYFGMITLALFIYLVLRKFENIKAIVLKEWAILLAAALAGALTVGSVTAFSPYALLHHLPIFNQMRVPSRFIGWLAFGVIIFLVRLPRKPLFYFLLVISVLDVFIAGYPILSYHQATYQAQKPNATFQQYEFFQTDPNLGVTQILDIQNYRLLRSTQLNIGEVYGYEPILNVAEYYYLPGTRRCGINHGCQFVLTGNAAVTYWSPLKISLRRTGPGVIKLNMNPGKVWHVNGAAPFEKYKILELEKDFAINDSAKTIDVTYSPAL